MSYRMTPRTSRPGPGQTPVRSTYRHQRVSETRVRVPRRAEQLHAKADLRSRNIDRSRGDAYARRWDASHSKLRRFVAGAPRRLSPGQERRYLARVVGPALSRQRRPDSQDLALAMMAQAPRLGAIGKAVATTVSLGLVLMACGTEPAPPPSNHSPQPPPTEIKGDTEQPNNPVGPNVIDGGSVFPRSDGGMSSAPDAGNNANPPSTGDGGQVEPQPDGGSVDPDRPDAQPVQQAIDPYAEREGPVASWKRRSPVECELEIGAVEGLSDCFEYDEASGSYVLTDAATQMARGMNIFAMVGMPGNQLFAAVGDRLVALYADARFQSADATDDLADTETPDAARLALATLRDGQPLATNGSDIEIVDLEGKPVTIGSGDMPLPNSVGTLEVARDGKLRNFAIITGYNPAGEANPAVHLLEQQAPGRWVLSNLLVGNVFQPEQPVSARFSPDGTKLYIADQGRGQPGVYVFDVNVDLDEEQGALTVGPGALLGGQPVVGTIFFGPRALGVLSDGTILAGLAGAGSQGGARIRFIHPDGTQYGKELDVPGDRVVHIAFVGDDAKTMLVTVANGSEHEVYAVPLNIAGMQDGVTCGEDVAAQDPDTYLRPFRAMEGSTGVTAP